MASSWPSPWPSGVARVLVLTPHPDDELFCASLLATASAAGVEVSLVCATRGERGWVFGKRAPADEVAALRAAELSSAAAALGITSVENLGFDDAGLGDDAAPAIAEAIDRAAPDLIASFAPDGGYGHRDHVKLVELTAAALAARAERPRWLQRRFAPGDFGETTAALRRSAPELLAGGVDLTGASPDEIDWVIDCGPTLEARRAALEAHASQRWLLDRLPALRCDAEWYVER